MCLETRALHSSRCSCETKKKWLFPLEKRIFHPSLTKILFAWDEQWKIAEMKVIIRAEKLKQ